EAARPIDPRLIPAVRAGAAARPELGILHVEGLDALVIEIDEREVVELLEHEVARVVKNARARMSADRFDETLERRAVVQILARMQLEADVDARVVERVEYRTPAPRELREPFLDESRRALRPRIDRMPEERTGEGRVRGEPEMRARPCRRAELARRPLAPLARIRADRRRGEACEQRRVRRMHRNELTLQVRRQLGDLDADVAE